MSAWQIRIPHRTRDDSAADVVDAIGETLEGEEARVTRQVVFGAMARGTTRAGDLIDELNAAGADGRRQTLNRAREGVGLETVEATEGLPRA